MLEPSAKDFTAVIDHTYLQSEREGVSRSDQAVQVRELVAQACRYGAFSVCVRPWMVVLAKKLVLAVQSKVKICSVIGFPDGDSHTSEQKLDELYKALEDGADEIDMVLAVGGRKEGRKKYCYDELAKLSEAAKDHVLKVIVENAYLPKELKSVVWQEVFSVLAAGPHLERRFIKTSTGFAKPDPGVAVGATLEDVTGMYQITQGRCGIKPAGGIKSLADARAFFKAVGAPRLADTQIDPYRFRIGSSSLLQQLSAVDAEHPSTADQSLY